MSQPYTHAIHARACRKMALQGVVAANLMVQVQKRGITYCGVIKAPWTTPDGLDCWTIETTLPESARFTVPCKQVRQCAGLDGSCACAGELALAAKSRASLAAPGVADEANSQVKDHFSLKVFAGEVAVTPHLSLKNETFCDIFSPYEIKKSSKEAFA